MIHFRDDPTYAAASDRSNVVGIEIATITNQLDLIQVAYLREGVHTPARDRAELVEKRSALRLESRLLNDVLLTIKSRARAAVRKDLLDTLVDVLNEHGLGHFLATATERRNAA